MDFPIDVCGDNSMPPGHFRGCKQVMLARTYTYRRIFKVGHLTWARWSFEGPLSAFLAFGGFSLSSGSDSYPVPLNF